MLGPWMMVILALTLAGVPGCAQPEVAGQEVALAEPPDLGDLLHQAERLLLREDLLQLPADQGYGESELQVFEPGWVSKRQHPGKREAEEEKEGIAEEEEEEEGGAAAPHKRQHPGRREDAAMGPMGTAQQKRQHPGRRSWLRDMVAKRQHPGRRLVELWAQEGNDKKEEGWEEEEEEEQRPEKRQHPGKRALGGSCGPWRVCGQARLLLGLLEGLSGDPGSENKRQHPGRRAARAGGSLEA